MLYRAPVRSLFKLIAFKKTENIAAVLERLYFEGDPKEPMRTAYLRGVVAVGEVPLPVVNKGGNRFISLFPYTDFEQRAYIFNPVSGDFEFKGDSSTPPQPEIWHGDYSARFNSTSSGKTNARRVF